MSILIRGMEMPTSCEECQTVLGCCDELEDGTVWCRLAHGYIGDERTVCPLDAVPVVLERDRWVSDPQQYPNTDSGVVGYFGGGAFDQLRWFDFITTLSDGKIVAESTERDVINEHLIAVFQLPEPPKEV